jgi:hypothetical protein
MTAKLEKIEGKFVLVLSEELVSQLDWTHGDIVEASANENELRVIRIQTKHDRAMKIADEIMDEYHDTLSTLAKT